MTPSGIASPHYKTGRHSKYLPTRMHATYGASLVDPQLLEMRQDISLVDARLLDLLSRVDTGESGALWANLQAARLDLLACNRSGDKPGQTMAINSIVELIGQGHADYRAWGEVGSVLEQRRRLVESEHKRLVAAQQMITVEKALLLIGAIGGIIKAHVDDRSILSKITTDINALVTLEAGE